MNIEKYIPILAPFPPAVVIGLQLYDEVMVAAADPFWWWLAALAAFVGTIGTIGAEMLAYKQALKALAERELLPFLLSALGALAVSGLIVWAVWRSDDSRPLVVAVLVAIVGYLVSAVNDYLIAKKERREKANENQARSMDYNLKIEQERTKQARAAARSVRPVRVEGEQDEQDERKPNSRLNPERLSAVSAYLSEHSGASVREVMQACHISSSDVASRYMKAVKR